MYRYVVSLLISMTIDVVSLTAAFFFCFDLNVDAEVRRMWMHSLPLFLLVKSTVFTTFGNWQLRPGSSIVKELLSIFATATLSSSILGVANLAGLLEEGPPLSVIGYDWGLTVLAAGMMRAAISTEGRNSQNQPRWTRAKKAIVYCATPQSMTETVDWATRLRGLTVVGLIDATDTTKPSANLKFPLIKISTGLSRITRRLCATHLVIPAGLPGSIVRSLFKEARASGLEVCIGSELEATDSRVAPRLREIAIADFYRVGEPSGRSAKVLETYSDRTVLITGAAGSIGSECCRQILKFAPKLLIMVDQSESGIAQIQRELTAIHTHDTRLFFAVADINDQVILGRLFGEYLPDVVVHAAGYCNSQLMNQNIQTVIRNNVIGVKSVVDLAERFGSERVVLVSSDKAFCPTEIIGATHVIGEQYIQAVSTSSKTQFITVRTGNALGAASCQSSAMVHQINEGGPLCLTSAVTTLEFTTIPDLAKWILQAGAVGESGQLLSIRQPECVKLVDLAKDLIAVSGRRFPDEIDIVFTVNQANETHPDSPMQKIEQHHKTMFDNIFCIERKPTQPKLAKQNMQRLERASHGDAREARDVIRSIVVEYAVDEIHELIQESAPLSKILARRVA